MGRETAPSQNVLPAADSRLRGYTIDAIPFRESCEAVVGIDNMDPLIRAERVGIRMLVKTLGFERAAPILRAASSAIPTLGRRARYVRYLARLNAARLDYLASLGRNDLLGAVEKKNRWAELTIRESRSPLARWTAREYLGLLAKYGCYQGPYTRRPDRRYPSHATERRRFYIYGPNANAAPSKEYADYTLVMNKPMPIDLAQFEGAMLFTNGMYYTNTLSTNPALRAEVIEKYGNISVACRTSDLRPPFFRTALPLSDNLASPMGLGRVLHDLLTRFGAFDCVIEGYDFYLDRVVVQDYYPTSATADLAKREHLICIGLAHHDALYNFLFVKDLIGRLKLVDSQPFREIVRMSGVEYLERMRATRDFSTVRP